MALRNRATLVAVAEIWGAERRDPLFMGYKRRISKHMGIEKGIAVCGHTDRVRHIGKVHDDRWAMAVLARMAHHTRLLIVLHMPQRNAPGDYAKCLQTLTAVYPLHAYAQCIICGDWNRYVPTHTHTAQWMQDTRMYAHTTGHEARDHKDWVITSQAMKPDVVHYSDGVTMQVEEDKARIANPRGWPVSKDDLRSLKEDIELRIFQISEEQQELELKDRWKSHYNQFTGRSVDGDETDLFYQYLDDDRFIVDGNDFYLDVWALLSECYSVSRDEYGKSNLAAADDFEEKIKNLPSKIQEVLRRRKVAFGPLMAHGSCEKLVTMDLEFMDEHKNTTVRSKPFPASKADSEEKMRQITECIAADLAEKYEQAEYPKHCSPCFLVDKPGSNAKRLVVHYGKLNKLTKKHSGSLPSLEQALERAAHCRFKSKLDKRL